MEWPGHSHDGPALHLGFSPSWKSAGKLCHEDLASAGPVLVRKLSSSGTVQ